MSMWALYYRPYPKKRRRRFGTYVDEGEACATLRYAILHAPGLDWKVRKESK